MPCYYHNNAPDTKSFCLCSSINYTCLQKCGYVLIIVNRMSNAKWTLNLIPINWVLSHFGNLTNNHQTQGITFSVKRWLSSKMCLAHTFFLLKRHIMYVYKKIYTISSAHFGYSVKVINSKKKLFTIKYWDRFKRQNVPNALKTTG
jgi:hypothetical protein